MSEKILHWCEVCDTEAELTSEEAFSQGWDFPPNFGAFGVISQRTCPNCYLTQTAWFALTFDKPLTERHRKTIERIKKER